MKIRYKGWRHQLDQVKQGIDSLILGTPSSELRNKLTEVNLIIMEIKDFDKKQKEVL